MNLVFLKIGYLAGEKKRQRRVVGHNVGSIAVHQKKKKKTKTKDPRNSTELKKWEIRDRKQGWSVWQPASSFLPFLCCLLICPLSAEAHTHSAFGNISPKKE